jgi:hypothetical protein
MFNTFFPKIAPFMKKYGRAMQAADDSILFRREDAICVPDT